MSYKNFVPEIWEATLHQNLHRVQVYSKLLNQNYDGTIRAFGDIVDVNQLGSTARDKLMVDNAKYFNFPISDIDDSQLNFKLVEAAVRRSSYDINDSVDRYVGQLIASGCDERNVLTNSRTAIIPTVENAYDYLSDLSVVLSENNIPMLDRWVVIPIWYHALLLKDERFISNGCGYNQALFNGGLVGEVAGFNVYLSNNVPSNNGKYTILAGTSDAGAYAGEFLELGAYHSERNYAVIKGLFVFGAKITNPSALALLTVNKRQDK